MTSLRTDHARHRTRAQHFVGGVARRAQQAGVPKHGLLQNGVWELAGIKFHGKINFV